MQIKIFYFCTISLICKWFKIFPWSREMIKIVIWKLIWENFANMI